MQPCLWEITFDTKKSKMYQFYVAIVLGLWEMTLTCRQFLRYQLCYARVIDLWKMTCRVLKTSTVSVLCFQSIMPMGYDIDMYNNFTVPVSWCQSITPMEDDM